MVTGSPVLLSLFQWENKNVDLITLDFLIFSIQIQISSDLLCPIMLILPHLALPHLSMKEFSPEEPKCLKQVSGSNHSGIGMASPCVCEKTKFICEIALCPSGGGGWDQDSASSLECEVASNSWYELAGNIQCHQIKSYLFSNSKKKKCVWSVSF